MKREVPEVDGWTYEEDPDAGMTHVWTLDRNPEYQVWLRDDSPTGAFIKYDWGVGLCVKPSGSYEPFPPETFDSEDEAIEWAVDLMESNPEPDAYLAQLALP